MSARAALSLEDLRRVARVSREEGVDIRATRETNGAITFTFHPLTTKVEDAGDLDERLKKFAAR